MVAVNDVTGAKLMTRVPSKEYQDGHDRIFGKKEEKIMKVFDTFEEVNELRECIKRPIVVHAKQFTEEFRVNTLEGNYKQGKPGDYLMKGIDGELYICDREIFEKTYDWVIDLRG